MITTLATADRPVINWELNDVIDAYVNEWVMVLEAAGTDEEGNNYTGEAYFFNGVFEQMEGVEKL